MSEPLKFRSATPADDSALRALLSRNPMPGSISLSMRHDPSFFQAAEVEGNRTSVMVCEDGKHVVGMGVVSEKEVYVGGTPERIGYISRLRLDSAYRGGTALVKGYRYFKSIHEREFQVPYYLSTIMESNTHAVSILTAGRADLPVYRDVGGFVTLAIPILSRWKPRHSSIHVIGGEEAGVEKIVRCLQQYGSEKSFYPVYREEDINGKSGLLRGLNLSDFYAAVEGEVVTGVMACWDQRGFRPNIVNSYSGIIGSARKPLNFTARLFGCTPLPAPGEVIPALHGACIAIRNSDPEVFSTLLMYVLADVKKRNASLFLLGLSEKDPLLKVATKVLHIKIRSRIFSVSWDGVHPIASDGIPYLELGSL